MTYLEIRIDWGACREWLRDWGLVLAVAALVAGIGWLEAAWI